MGKQFDAQRFNDAIDQGHLGAVGLRADIKDERPINRDAELLGRIMRLIDDHPIDFICYARKVMHAETYDKIAMHVAKTTGRVISRQRIHQRIQRMGRMVQSARELADECGW